MFPAAVQRARPEPPGADSVTCGRCVFRQMRGDSPFGICSIRGSSSGENPCGDKHIPTPTWTGYADGPGFIPLCATIENTLCPSSRVALEPVSQSLVNARLPPAPGASERFNYVCVQTYVEMFLW